MKIATRLLLLFVSFAAANAAGAADKPAGEVRAVGVARVDITPDYPVRLSGFAFRRAESEGVRQKIWAKALAIGADDDRPAVLITVESLGIPDRITAEIAGRLQKKAGLDPARLAVTFSHTHTAPMLSGVCSTLFGMPIPQEHQEHIDRYTRELTDKLEEVALAALKDRQPARLAWGVGKVDLAMNRRTKGGPVDHELPVLVVRDPAGKIRVIYLSYACHCVTLSDNKISGDWAGYALEQIERSHPGAIALASIGCGADSNPRSGVTGDKGEVAEAQGVEIAAEVDRVLKGALRAVTGPLEIQRERIDLAFAALPTRDEFAEKGKKQDVIGYHARVQLARLERGEALRTKISYPVQSWAFGDSLAMVFLPGEVVVDYSLRLKRELNGRRLWVNAYSNDAPCYIPSERILKEGGYEGGGAMVYYDQPTRLASGLEQQIVAAVERQIGKKFAAPAGGGAEQGAPALPAERSLATVRTKAGLAVELVAAEPLVASPVAIDFGPDGKLWVAEMADYPLGLDGKYQPGGRVRLLQSTKDDGRFDRSAVFLEGIPFPTGVTVWRKGVLVCAAPDILYAEDTDGDGKADKVRKLFSGFGTDNYQARVNSLEYGLDGWVYGSCGLFGGIITNDAGKPPVALGDRDFRIKPDEGVIEPATGRTQQGRVRDDWGNWFGCDNSNLIRHYPLADEYLRRNPYITPAVTAVSVPEGPEPNRLYPATQHLQLFKLSGPAGRTTAACGLGIYRDNWLGGEYHGNAFTCEPVNLLVHRRQLVPRGFTFAGRRAADEAESEFLASTDPWFRPVQARTGPDGALWIVDMYRQVIEHPRWIPPEALARVDVRAGADNGRIYRVIPKAGEPRPWPRLDRADTAGLVAALETPNGWQRDMAAQLLAWKNDAAAVEPLGRLALTGKSAESRLAALCLLDRLGALRAGHLFPALADSHPGVRRHALRLAEKLVDENPALGMALPGKLDDPDPQVRLQLACSLGAWHDPRGGRALATLLLGNLDEPIMTAAVFSSLHAKNVSGAVAGVLGGENRAKIPPALLEKLFEVAAAVGGKTALPEIVTEVCTPHDNRFDDWQLAALGGIYAALERRHETPMQLVGEAQRKQIRAVLDAAAHDVQESRLSEARRIAALRLVVRDLLREKATRELLVGLLAPGNSPALQGAAAAALGRFTDNSAAEALTANWRSYTPAMKSRVIDILLSRDPWQLHLLETVPAAEIDATRRQRLLTSRSERIRKLAEERFSGAVTPDRKKVLDDYRDVAGMRGDHQRGRAIFVKTCAACHRLGEAGHAVGPDLVAVANKTPQYLLQEILDPNRNVDSRYVSYVAVTKAGRSFTGLLASETAGSITLKGAEGKQEVILRADLDELQSSSLSLMPVGLEKDLSKQNLADLIAYLAAVGPLPKPFDGNSPAVVRPAGGALALLATNGEIYGDEILFEAPFRNIGYWHGANDHVVWTIEIDKPGPFDVWFDWACDDVVAGNRFALAAGEKELRGAVAGTGGWDKYRLAKIGTLSLPAGALRISLRPEGPAVNGALMDLRGIHLGPRGATLAAAAADPKPAADPQAPIDVKLIARQILDDDRPANQREELARAHVARAGELVAAMTADLPADPKEEYRRIPWIWRVAIAAGRKNDKDVLRSLLKTSLPKRGEPLRDWQAVVIGGGIINGVSQQGVWPGDRMKELLEDQPELSQRWRQTLDQAAAMADNEKTPAGTRYDALRIIPLAGWKQRGEQLAEYLLKGAHDELQMGAISGMSDIDAPAVAPLLVEGLGHFSAANRTLAIDALLRTEARTAALVEALENRQVKPADLKEKQVEVLRTLKNEKLRARAERALSP
ncbi:MAG: PVC-type heme-binding CxxCH protein [Deltaproteobacteria bacterium]